MSHTPGQRLAVYVDRFQYVAGCAQFADPRILLTELQDLVEVIPERMPVLDEFAVRILFAQAVSRVLQAHRADRDAKVERDFVAFMSCGLGIREWRRAATELLKRCDHVLNRSRQPRTSKVAHVQVMGALRMIDARYADPNLGLAAVAAEIGLSPSHLSRKLREHTNRGLLEHLHERRIAAAVHLLTHAPHLAIKEVAAAVGYRSVAQLARHCKRLHGVVPTTIRARVSLTHRVAG